MAEVFDRADLEHAKRNIDDLDSLVNGAADLNGNGKVETRTGGPRKTYALLQAEAERRLPGLTYATAAALTADLAPNDKSLALALDTGKYYIKNGASGAGNWTLQTAEPGFLISNYALGSSGKNQFAASQIIEDQEVYFEDGRIVTDIPNSATSGLMDVRDWEFVRVSGLFDNGAFIRNWRLVRADGTTVVAFGAVAPSILSFVVPRHPDAWFFQFDVYKRNDAPGSTAAIQVERGPAATAYEASRKDVLVYFSGKPAQRDRLEIETVGTKNLFNKATITDGKEVYNDGSLNDDANSAYSAPIYVGHLRGQNIHISGLKNSDFSRYYNFHSSKTIAPGTKVAGGFINQPDNDATLAVPANANYFIFSPRQRTTPIAGDYYDTIQVEAGSQATAFEAFTARVGAINGARAGDYSRPASAAANGNGAGFGDSITEVTNVDAGDHLYPTGYRNNWPDYAIPLIGPEKYYSYAKSGAAFASAVGLTTNQKLVEQVNAAIADNFPLRWLIVAALTNDIGNGNPVSTYDVVMGKTLRISPSGVITTDLDLTNTSEAARYVFFRLQQWRPFAKRFYMTPLQRGDLTPESMLATIEIITRLARRYGFEIIDGFGESGIVSEMERGTVTASIAGNTMTVSATQLNFPLRLGQTISGAGVTSTTITALGTGTGEAGTYTIGGAAQNVTSRAITIAGGIDTYDGLHTEIGKGQLKQGQLVASRIIPRLVG